MTADESERTGLGHEHRRARRPVGVGRPERSSSRIIGGVAGGLAEFIGADPRSVRWLWVVSLPLSGGLTAIAYLVLWVMLSAKESDARWAGPARPDASEEKKTAETESAVDEAAKAGLLEHQPYRGR